VQGGILRKIPSERLAKREIRGGFRLRIAIDWKQHALTGIPVTLGSLVVVWGWMRWLG
jgi:hypothetical protein